MTQTHSLTAYRCKFSFMERNNPVDTEEMKESIKNGDIPKYSLGEFLQDYIDSVSSLSIGQNSDRAIQLTQITSTLTIGDGSYRTHIQPQAGKHGEPLIVLEKATNKQHKYTPDDAALYDYNVFFYEKADDVIAIFHRKGTSGCKTVFLETANNVLRLKGLNMKMELVVPLNSHRLSNDGTPSEVILRWSESVSKSTDIAENINKGKGKGKPKTKAVQTMIINLKSDKSNPIMRIIDNLRGGKIDNATAFAEISTKYLGDENRANFNDAQINLKIGNKIVSKIKFGEIEDQLGAYNITDSVKASDLVASLTKCSDDYYMKIMEDRT